MHARHSDKVVDVAAKSNLAMGDVMEIRYVHTTYNCNSKKGVDALPRLVRDDESENFAEGFGEFVNIYIQYD